MDKIFCILLIGFGLHISANASTIAEPNPSVILKDSIVTTTFAISNLGCATDAQGIQKAISQTKGIKSVKVDAQKSTAVVTYSANKISKEEIVKIIENCSLCHDKNNKPFKAKELN